MAATMHILHMQLASRRIVENTTQFNLCVSAAAHGQYQIGVNAATSLNAQFEAHNALCGTVLGGSARWRLQHILSMHLSSSGHKRHRCLSAHSIHASGPRENVEELWKEFFADPSQWWDNRSVKANSRCPDFKHRLTRKALWIEGWSNPPWVKSKLIAMTGGKVKPYVDSKKLICWNYNRRRNIPLTEKELLEILHSFDQRDIPVDYYTYVKVLQEVCKMKDLAVAKQVHDHVARSGLVSNIYILNNLLKVYISCGSLFSARKVFDKILQKDNVSWTIMIGGYVQHGECKVAFDSFLQMQQEGVEPDAITCLSTLSACACPEALEWGKEIHTYIIMAGLQSSVQVGNALIKMYAKCGSNEDARQVFGRMVRRDAMTWTTLIGAYAESGHGDVAFKLFLQMQQEGMEPNAITYLSILNPCASGVALEWVQKVHFQATEDKHASDVRVSTALVKMYAKSGSIEDALRVFHTTPNRNTNTWNAMIGAYAESGSGHEVSELFFQMQQEGFVPDAGTYSTVLMHCGSSQSLEWANGVYDQAVKAGLELDLGVGNALFSMSGKSGSIKDAQQVDRIGQ